MKPEIPIKIEIKAMMYINKKVVLIVLKFRVIEYFDCYKNIHFFEYDAKGIPILITTDC
jgi:hypothetical protein